MTNAEFVEFHDELRSVAADLLAKDGDVDWRLLVDAGWVGLEVPDALGGAGASFTEVALILEEMGRAATASNYLGGAVLAVGALKALQPSASRDRLLAEVCSGTTRCAVVLGGMKLDDTRLFGRAEFVPDAEGAERLLVLVEDSAGALVADVSGLTVTPQPVLDETRSLAVVSADGTEAMEILRFDGDPAQQVRLLIDRAAVAIACDSLGLGDAMLTATVSYAKMRHQFGRPIGSFQAVKHACADMLVRVSVARQLVRAATQAIADGSPDASTAASMAKAYSCAAAVDIAGKAMQLHGGIGYTWDSGIHVYLKRAAINRSLFGSPASHRKQLARRYLQGNLT